MGNQNAQLSCGAAHSAGDAPHLSSADAERHALGAASAFGAASRRLFGSAPVCRALVWHERVDKNPAHQWLRSFLLAQFPQGVFKLR